MMWKLDFWKQSEIEYHITWHIFYWKKKRRWYITMCLRTAYLQDFSKYNSISLMVWQSLTPFHEKWPKSQTKKRKRNFLQFWEIFNSFLHLKSEVFSKREILKYLFAGPFSTPLFCDENEEAEEAKRARWTPLRRISTPATPIPLQIHLHPGIGCCRYFICSIW